MIMNEVNNKDKLNIASEAVKNMNAEYLRQTGRNKIVSIQTYGCQMNEHDSERMLSILEDLGYEYSDDRNEADLIIFNTCSI